MFYCGNVAHKIQECCGENPDDKKANAAVDEEKGYKQVELAFHCVDHNCDQVCMIDGDTFFDFTKNT